SWRVTPSRRPTSASSMLDVRDLRVDYGIAPALWSVSLAIGAGEVVCVVGPNGAGKTTLINAIAGLHPARSGRITMDGCEMTLLPPHRFCAKGVAIIAEGRRLFGHMTVRENLEIGSYAHSAHTCARKAAWRPKACPTLCLTPPICGMLASAERRHADCRARRCFGSGAIERCDASRLFAIRSRRAAKPMLRPRYSEPRYD